MEVQTHLLPKVGRFDDFFGLYKMEHQWLSQQTDFEIITRREGKCDYSEFSSPPQIDC